MNVVRIREVHLIVVPDIAKIRANITAAGSYGFQRMTFQDPVADIKDMDVLIQQYAAGNDAIPVLVTNTEFVARHGRPHRVVHGSGVIVGGNASDLTDCALVNAAHQFDKRRSNTDLKTYIQTEAPLPTIGRAVSRLNWITRLNIWV
jgi:hypothetical protein